jgi:hypothetical protein
MYGKPHERVERLPDISGMHLVQDHLAEGKKENR